MLKNRKGFIRQVLNHEASMGSAPRASRFSTAGFTLIETLVAISIFAFAITGLISITARGVFDMSFVKNKFTAGYLSLEGAEMVRNIRDTAATQNIAWSTVFPGNGNGYLGDCIRGDDEACTIDSWTEDILPCPAVSCPAMTYNLDTGRFGYEGQNTSTILASIFKRTIYITVINPREVLVTSEVEWTQGETPHKVVYTYNLLDWAGP